jgi:hypothetical protein
MDRRDIPYPEDMLAMSHLEGVQPNQTGCCFPCQARTSRMSSFLFAASHAEDALPHLLYTRGPGGPEVDEH